MAADEAAGEVDALLFAAGEGGGREGVQAGWDVETVEQGGGFGMGGAAVRRGLGDDVDGGDAGDDAEDLADVA